MSKEAMKLALEALEVATTPLARDRQEVLRAITALREELAEQPAQKQEPVSVMTVLHLRDRTEIGYGPASAGYDLPTGEYKLYTSPQPAQQEPYCWMSPEGTIYQASDEDVLKGSIPMYLGKPPAQRKPWVGLTDAELAQVMEAVNFTYNPTTFARALEAKLKEKNS